MKKMISLLFICTALHVPAQTQAEMNEAEYRRYVAADKELNDTYQKILKEYKSDRALCIISGPRKKYG